MPRTKISGIYQIVNKMNGKRYIGQSVDIQKRFWDHVRELNNQTHRNSYLQRSWNKYGDVSFDFEIIEICTSEELNEKETFWIRHYKCDDQKYGYNTNDGGDSRRPNAETREKHRVGNLGKKRSPETCQLIGDIHRGLKMSDEAKQKMRTAKLGKKLSPEHVQKIVDSRKGYSPSDETRRKMSMALTGKRRSEEVVRKQIGRKMSDTAKQNMSNARMGKEPWNKGKTNVYSDQTKQKMKENMVVRRGEDVSNKLTEDQVTEMMSLFEQKSLKNREIAEYFQISISTLKDIKQGKNWRHVTGYLNKKERDAMNSVVN